MDCYISLGSNLGNPIESISLALKALYKEPEIFDLQTSRPYLTAPISDIPQPDYINAACRFSTSLDLLTLWKILQKIECNCGKIPKPKNAPRIFDIDLIFYGDQVIENEELTIPHPRWQERLFVIAPLRDIVSNDFFIDLSSLCERNKTQQVKPLPFSLPFESPNIRNLYEENTP